MQLATVVGHAVSTLKHPSLTGWRLLVVQPRTPAGQPDGEPLLAIDSLGARRNDRVLISNDGQGARELVGAANSPVRWFVMGIADSEQRTAHGQTG
jgi:ethanolamine utilization protein EutN